MLGRQPRRIDLLDDVTAVAGIPDAVLGTGHGDVADGDASDRNGRFAVLDSGERAMPDILPGADDVEPVGDGDEHGIWKWRHENSLAGVARSQQPGAHRELRERIGAASGASVTRAFPASAKSAGASCSCAEPDSVASKLAAMESSRRRVVVSVFSICPQGVALCVRSATNSTMLHIQKGCRPATAVLRLTDRRVISPSAGVSVNKPHWEHAHWLMA